VCVPEEIHGKPVAFIAPKAFLSQTGIEKLTLPGTVTTVGDWAFCHMKHLHKLVLSSVPVFGRQVWKGCQELRAVELTGYAQGGLPKLIASAIPFWPESFCTLQEALEAGDLLRWYGGFDDAFTGFLHQADETGFVPGFVGWFDDSDVDVEREKYCKQMRETKNMLVLERLRYDKELSDDAREEYRAYLLGQKEGLLPVLCGEKCAHDVEYLKVFEEIGGLKVVDAGTILEKMDFPDPEVTAFLISFTQGSEGAVFEELLF